MQDQQRVALVQTVVSQLGGKVEGWDAVDRAMTVVIGDEKQVISLGDAMFDVDKAAAERWLFDRLRPKPAAVPDSKWPMNHAVLARRVSCKSPILADHDRIFALRCYKVANLSPSGLYVHFISLTDSEQLWVGVDEYDLVEDLGAPIAMGSKLRNG